MLKVLDPTGQY
ncbi:tarsal-less isoform 3A [Bombyx mori]|uniref:Tal-like protein 3A n=1 Tax=Bombyx mori TaxID=7091 RepID=A3RLR4_BOMMO|nr:tarsal-less isoform 3A [Bombyx mori]ABO09847.1 tal-like protein 3A [Bombyx mori]